MARLEFWYEFASTYSYPAAARIEHAATAAGVGPVKGRYMWRDLQRICQEALEWSRRR